VLLLFIMKISISMLGSLPFLSEPRQIVTKRVTTAKLALRKKKMLNPRDIREAGLSRIE